MSPRTDVKIQTYASSTVSRQPCACRVSPSCVPCRDREKPRCLVLPAVTEGAAVRVHTIKHSEAEKAAVSRREVRYMVLTREERQPVICEEDNIQILRYIVWANQTRGGRRARSIQDGRSEPPVVSAATPRLPISATRRADNVVVQRWRAIHVQMLFAVSVACVTAKRSGN